MNQKQTGGWVYPAVTTLETATVADTGQQLAAEAADSPSPCATCSCEPRRHENDSVAVHASRLCLRVGLPSELSPETVLGETDKLLELAHLLEFTLTSASENYASTLLSSFSYNILRGLVTVVFDVDSVEALLAYNTCNERPQNVQRVQGSEMGRFKTLQHHLRNSDIYHQSALQTTRILIQEFPNPHARTTDIQPSLPVYNELTGRADSRFKRRELDPHESMHPYFDAVAKPAHGCDDRCPTPDSTASDGLEYSSSFVQNTDVPVGHCSVAGTLEQFVRAFEVFTMGVFRGTPLHRSRAIVTGGAVTACLMPWPKHIRQLYIEERLMAWIIESALGFPVEIGRQISSYVDNIQKAKRATDEALFDWLCSDSSVYGSSDIDVFFIAPLNATTVDDALDALPEMHRQISLHRSKANVRRYAHKDSNPGWVFDENWYHEVKQNYYGLYTPRRRRRTAEASTDDEDDRENGGERDDGNDEFLQDEDYDWFYRTWGTIQGKDWKGHFRRKGFHKFAKDGWTNYMEEAVAGRMALLPSIRTTNSVTMCGLWPVRHTQLMLPVVRAAEQVVEAFDLDCVRVFYDGQNVYATHRALRAFNTRTNFIDHVSARDNFRVRRMKKYQRRGFTPVYFDTCSHHPRCDVHAAQYVRDTLDRHVHPLEQEDQEDRNFQDDAMDGAHDYVPETIAYGSSVDLSALRRRIQPVVKGEGELRAWATALELPYTSVLSDPAVFRREISCPRTENPGRHWTFEWRSPTACAQVPKWRTWPPMQFKFVKDAWVQRKLHLLAAFDVCYMCGVDIEAEMRREKERLSGSVRGGKGSQSQLSGGLLDEQATSTKSGYFISLNDRSNDEKYSDEDYDSDEDLYVEGEVPDTPEKVPICSGCARINMLKREQKVAMHGVQCLVMGVEDEILFQTAVQMLEWGATVLVTTRFPLLTARRLKRLSGSGDWWNQIMVKYLNLSDMDAEGAFVQEIQDSGVLPALGVVINNTFGIPEGEANFGRLERAESKAVACAGPDLREICLDFESYEQIFSAAAKAPGKAPAFVPPAEVALANNRLLMNGLLPLLASPAPAAPSASVFVNVVPPGDMLPLSLPREPAIPNRIGDIASAKVSRTALLEFTRELFSLAACVGVCVAAVEPGWTARIPWVEAKPLCRRNRVYYRNAEEPLTLRKKTREELIIAPLDVQDGVARVLDVVIAGLKGDGERLAGGLVRHFLRVKE